MRLSFEDVSMVGFPVEVRESSVEQSNATELDLVRQMQTGNEMAYRKFVEGYQSQVFRVACQILRNREEADEIAQQIFAKIYFAVKGFDARSCLYTWVFGIAVNECYGFLRKKRLNVPNENSQMHASHLSEPSCRGTYFTDCWSEFRQRIGACCY